MYVINVINEHFFLSGKFYAHEGKKKSEKKILNFFSRRGKKTFYYYFYIPILPVGMILNVRALFWSILNVFGKV